MPLLPLVDASLDSILRQGFGSQSLSPLEQLAAVNVFLAAFNLLPAFPMDGGRVLRAVLAIWLPRNKATNIAGWIGQAMAVLFGAIGLVTADPLLILVACFIFSSARRARPSRQRGRKQHSAPREEPSG